MANILFAVDDEEGHVLASLGLAKQLAARHHQVSYLGGVGSQEMVRRESIRFDLMPGARGEHNDQGHFSNGCPQRDELFRAFFRDAAKVDALIDDLHPDYIVLLSYMALEGALLNTRYSIPIAFLRTFYSSHPRTESVHGYCWEILERSHYVNDILSYLKRRAGSLTTLPRLIALICNYPELVTLPEGFELGGSRNDPNAYYIGPTVDLQRNESAFDWRSIPPDKNLIFCTLGSQCDLDPENGRRLFAAVIEAVNARQEWYAIVAVGKRLNVHELPAARNVLTTNWAPQLSILAQASMMITHGGMGTMRECILHEVPMLVYPLMRDQFEASEAIREHGLGIVGDIGEITAEVVGGQIDQVLHNGPIKQRLKVWHEKFVACDNTAVGADVIQRLHEGGAKKSPVAYEVARYHPSRGPI